jgi:DNA gyrase/topoisomerase IV subunit A
MLDDNQKIEPEWYMPIIPMVLVNGADGIGTGWMTKIPNFNPREIVEVQNVIYTRVSLSVQRGLVIITYFSYICTVKEARASLSV